MESYMTYGSRFGKLRSREKLLDLVGTLRPCNGDETVLDIGCGRGLTLIGAAKRLTSGQAKGIDLWRSEDQAGNSPEATQENAQREGVLNRISIDTGDARKLPDPDCSFDVVTSHWVVHNSANRHDRQVALHEMLRLIRPGGMILLADITGSWCDVADDMLTSPEVKIVLDTDILVAAARSASGASRQVLLAGMDRRSVLLVSPALLLE
jgi:ubiquinone/menaquinone biosynthesis C-methylase UbiE